MVAVVEVVIERLAFEFDIDDLLVWKRSLFMALLLVAAIVAPGLILLLLLLLLFRLDEPPVPVLECCHDDDADEDVEPLIVCIVAV